MTQIFIVINLALSAGFVYVLSTQGFWPFGLIAFILLIVLVAIFKTLFCKFLFGTFEDDDPRVISFTAFGMEIPWATGAITMSILFLIKGFTLGRCLGLGWGILMLLQGIMDGINYNNYKKK